MSLLSKALSAHVADRQRLHDFNFSAFTLRFQTGVHFLTTGGFAGSVLIPTSQIWRAVKLYFMLVLDFRLFFVQHVLCGRLDGAAVQRLRDPAQVGRVLLVEVGEMSHHVSLPSGPVAAERAAVKLDEEVHAVVRVELDVLGQVLFRAERPSAELTEACL